MFPNGCEWRQDAKLCVNRMSRSITACAGALPFSGALVGLVFVALALMAMKRGAKNVWARAQALMGNAGGSGGSSGGGAAYMPVAHRSPPEAHGQLRGAGRTYVGAQAGGGSGGSDEDGDWDEWGEGGDGDGGHEASDSVHMGGVGSASGTSTAVPGRAFSRMEEDEDADLREAIRLSQLEATRHSAESSQMAAANAAADAALAAAAATPTAPTRGSARAGMGIGLGMGVGNNGRGGSSGNLKGLVASPALSDVTVAVPTPSPAAKAKAKPKLKPKQPTKPAPADDMFADMGMTPSFSPATRAQRKPLTTTATPATPAGGPSTRQTSSLSLSLAADDDDDDEGTGGAQWGDGDDDDLDLSD